VISPSDPASAWTAKANKRVQFGYGLNYLIDNEHAIIVDVEPTPARTFDEVRATGVMIKRMQERFGLKPKRLAADTAYGTAKFLGWLAQEKIAPHIRADARGSGQKRAIGLPRTTLSGYSVVLPSKCSSPASASALVARTMPSR
jgi:hypothetical protein